LVVEWVEVKPTELQIRDPKDQPFIDLATTSPRPDFIITGDKDFEQNRYGEVPVISATLFVKVILNKGGEQEDTS
jgi:predicted nucleic acid-binding protein